MGRIPWDPSEADVQCSRDHSQETLFFYTHLRLPHNFSNSQKKQHLKYIIEAMGLFDYRHMTMASVASALTQAKPFRHVLHCATPRRATLLAACVRSYVLISCGTMQCAAAWRGQCDSQAPEHRCRAGANGPISM